MESSEDHPPTLTLGDFDEHVGETFHLTTDGVTTFEATLVEARDESLPDGRHGPPGGRAPFSLLFRPDDGEVKPQGAYAIETEGCGPHQIFLVPVLGPDGKPHLEASFN